MTDDNNNEQVTETTTQQIEEKILGRFESQDDLVNGYRELEKAFSKKENWEKKYNEDYTVPENYVAEGKLNNLDEDFIKDQAIKAKDLGLTQKQFEVFAEKNLSKYEESKNIEANKPEINDQLKKYLEEEVSMPQHLIGSLTKDDVEAFENKRQQSLNSRSSVNNSYHGENSAEAKSKAYRELKAAERSGNHMAARKAFEKWKSYTQG